MPDTSMKVTMTIDELEREVQKGRHDGWERGFWAGHNYVSIVAHFGLSAAPVNPYSTEVEK